MSRLFPLFIGLVAGPIVFFILRHLHHEPTDWLFGAQCVIVSALLFLFVAFVRPKPQYNWAGHLLLNMRCRRHSSLWMYAGQQDAFVKHACDLQWQHLPEEIWLTAVRHPDGVVYATERPGRHHHCIELMSECARAGGSNCLDQGFVTTHGRYVDRMVALYIAKQAGQLIGEPSHKLFSEDLWAGPVQTQRELELQAQKLVQDAAISCKVVTIQTVPKEPLAMGSYDMIPLVRDSLPVIRWRMDQERQAKAAAIVPSPEASLNANITPAKTA